MLKMVEIFFLFVSEEIMDFLFMKFLRLFLILVIFFFSDLLCLIISWFIIIISIRFEFEGKMGKISGNEVNLVMNRLGIYFDFEVEEGEYFIDCDLEGIFMEDELSLEEIWEVFKVFDKNKDGFIDVLELGIVLCKLGLIKEGFDVEMCNNMIRVFDRNGDGLLDFNDFVKFMEVCVF